jgi:hypothetical protein
MSIVDLSDLYPQPTAKVLSHEQIASSDPWQTTEHSFDVPRYDELKTTKEKQ